MVASFKDIYGIPFHLDIKMSDVERVRQLVRDVNGKEVDLLEMADTGNLYKLYSQHDTILRVVFVCLLEDIQRTFDEREFDAKHSLDIELGIVRTRYEKLQLYFGERINPEVIPGMIEAFKEALLFFIPNPRQKELLKEIVTKSEALESLQSQSVLDIMEIKKRKVEEALKSELEEAEKATPKEVLKEMRELGQNP